MRMVITGASGYVGSSFAEAFGKEHEVVGAGYSNPQQLLAMDVMDAAAVLDIASEYEPEIIIHAAEKLVFQADVDHLVLRPSLVVGMAPHTPTHTFNGRLQTAVTAELPTQFDDGWKFSPSWLKDLTTTIRWWIDNRQAANLLHVGTSEVTTQLEFSRRVAAGLDLDPMFLTSKDGPSFKHNVLDSSRARELGVPLHDLDLVVSGVALQIQEERHG